MLDKLTVVVTTHNRHHLLQERVLPHFLEFGVHLMVIDSSAQAHQWSVDNPGVDYIHCPNEPLPHKLVAPVIERVKTPYMLMSADDTLTSSVALEKCIAFLEENQDYSSAKGLVFQCHYDDKERLSTWNLEKSLIPVDAERPEDRLLQYFSLFDTHYYSLQRTDCWKNTLQRLPKEMVNYYLADTYMALMSVMHGKVAKFPIFYQATEAGPSINEKDRRYMCSPFKLATDSRYAVEVAATRKAAIAYLMQLSKLSEDVAKLYVDGALALYWLQDKKVKSFGDRVQAEWNRILEKTIFKERKKKRKEVRKKIIQAVEKKDFEEAYGVLDAASLDEFGRLMKVVQTTYM